MARKHYWQFLVTDEGNPIENAQISVYTAGTTDPVWVYTDEVGGAGTASPPQVRTSRKGYFEFWIGDENEGQGYDLSTKFKLAWTAAGVSSGYIDYIDVFSTAWEPVDETDSNEIRNKAVSNKLAKDWTDHLTAELPGDTPHGLDFVIETDNVSTDSGVRNKVISNYQAFVWDTHAKRQYDGSLATVSSPSESPIAHGIQQTDAAFSSVDATINKLVSDEMARRWNNHATNVDADPHTQYSLVDGTRNYTAGVGYSDGTIVDSVGDDDFVTKDFVQSKKYAESLLVAGWIDNGDGTYYRLVTHNLLAKWPLVQLWNTDSTPDELVQPESMESTDVNTLKVTVSTLGNFFIRVMV